LEGVFLSGFMAGHESQIAHSELDATFLEEVVRGRTTGKDHVGDLGFVLSNSLN
jgi:hypothetical protein